MKRAPGAWPIALCGLLLCGGQALAADDEQRVDYHCSEVVAVGRIKTLNYTDLSEPGDVLGHGRWDVEISIKHILYGRETRRIVSASAYGHGQLRGDADFWIVLAPSPKGYEIRTANLTRIPYHLARSCS
jgi:hypothetical protein